MHSSNTHYAYTPHPGPTLWIVTDTTQYYFGSLCFKRFLMEECVCTCVHYCSCSFLSYSCVPGVLSSPPSPFFPATLKPTVMSTLSGIFFGSCENLVGLILGFCWNDFARVDWKSMCACRKAGEGEKAPCLACHSFIWFPVSSVRVVFISPLFSFHCTSPSSPSLY